MKKPLAKDSNWIDKGHWSTKLTSRQIHHNGDKFKKAWWTTLWHSVHSPLWRIIGSFESRALLLCSQKSFVHKSTTVSPVRNGFTNKLKQFQCSNPSQFMKLEHERGKVDSFMQFLHKESAISKWASGDNVEKQASILVSLLPYSSGSLVEVRDQIDYLHYGA